MTVAKRGFSAILMGSLILAVVQAARVLMYSGVKEFLRPLDPDPLALRAGILIVLAAAFCFLAKPSARGMGFARPRPVPAAFVTGLLAFGWVLAMAGSAYLGWTTLAENFVDGGLLPLCEEALFRGFFWSALEEAWERPDDRGGTRPGKLPAFVATTLLFALWRVGYADLLAERLGPGADLARAAGRQALAGLCAGLAAGGLRAATGSVWAPVFCRGLWNIFAP
jgi:membrane protease YdiL (CAAX protease family)